jgi:hypothetical protein
VAASTVACGSDVQSCRVAHRRCGVPERRAALRVSHCRQAQRTRPRRTAGPDSPGGVARSRDGCAAGPSEPWRPRHKVLTIMGWLVHWRSASVCSLRSPLQRSHGSLWREHWRILLPRPGRKPRPQPWFGAGSYSLTVDRCATGSTCTASRIPCGPAGIPGRRRSSTRAPEDRP